MYTTVSRQRTRMYTGMLGCSLACARMRTCDCPQTHTHVDTHTCLGHEIDSISRSRPYQVGLALLRGVELQ